jgi:exonuclease SbcC
MLKSIKYRVQFPTTGRIIEANLLLDAGVTSISGPNEAGKSLIIEMIRYCLFGKAALRGPASDYRNLEATLVFVLEEQTYTVSRGPRAETISKGDQVLASGASTLNDFIPRLLGFNLTVFDITCAYNQGDIERLTNMLPAERKRMVDSVVGMNQLDGVEKWCRDEATRLKREATSIVESQRKPLLPVQPEGYADPAGLKVELDAMEAKHSEALRLAGTPAPAWPEDPGITETLEELQAFEALRASTNARRAELQRLIAATPVVNVTQSEIDEWRSWAAYKTEALRRGEKPTVTPVVAELDLTVWQEIADYDRASQRAVECPDCNARFVPGAAHLGERPPEPVLSEKQCRAELRANEAWAEPIVEVLEPQTHFNNEAEAREAEQALSRSEERAAAEKELAALAVWADRSADVRTLQRYEAQLEAAQFARVAWDSAQARLAEIGDTSVVEDLRRRYTEASVYAAQLEGYLLAEQGYDSAIDAADKKTQDAESLRRAGEALRLTRTKVKQHLIPALSRVASDYITSMTLGKRSSIVVDDNFNIVVDGQSVETLAGSGKAVANLAVRLGLGQVLTQRMFPIFLGDEIDAAMDAERAGATVETLRNLGGRLSQVILVSHKQLEADHSIQL